MKEKKEYLLNRWRQQYQMQMTWDLVLIFVLSLPVLQFPIIIFFGVLQWSLIYSNWLCKIHFYIIVTFSHLYVIVYLKSLEIILKISYIQADMLLLYSDLWVSIFCLSSLFSINLKQTKITLLMFLTITNDDSPLLMVII